MNLFGRSAHYALAVILGGPRSADSTVPHFLESGPSVLATAASLYFETLDCHVENGDRAS